MTANMNDNTPIFHVGTSGYSFENWLGTFYPSGLAQQKMLPFYAAQFDTVEVNFTYYRLPTARTTAAMTDRTPDDFTFFVKAHQSFTHDRDLAARERFLEGLAPMEESGKLAGLLFQFPQSFKNNEKNRAYLRAVKEEFKDHTLAVEFRDRSWDSRPVYSFLDENDLSFVCVDEPEISTLFPRNGEVTNETGYVRFHSRNGDNWYKDMTKRYDYLYSEEEMKEWLPMFKAIAKRARNIFVYFNNCHQGQAAQNAKEIKQLIKDAGIGKQKAEDDPLSPLGGRGSG